MTKTMRLQLRTCTRTLPLCLSLGLALFMAVAAPAFAQRLPGTDNGEWRYLGGDAGHTRYSPWTKSTPATSRTSRWRGFGGATTSAPTSTTLPVQVDLRRWNLYSVATPRRQVVAIDPATGETLWTFREPETVRHLRSPRAAYGKGVAYAEVDGRESFMSSPPAYFLWALDAKTGRPLENWGATVPVEGFSPTGVRDLIRTSWGTGGPGRTTWRKAGRTTGPWDTRESLEW